MRALIVSPLPPARTGVAEFAARIGQELRRFCEVDLAEEAPAERLAEYGARLYQIGNNRLHGGAYDAALAVPGVVELHDAVLHHFLLGRLSREDYLAEFVHNQGEWSRGLAEELWSRRGLAMAGDEHFRYPLLRRVTEGASAVIVHNPAAGRMAREALRSGRASVVEIPHYVDPPAAIPPERALTERRRLGVSDQETLISCFGFQRPAKRLRSVFEASRRMKRPHRVLVAGEFVSQEYAAAMEPWLAGPRTIRLPFLSPAQFWLTAAASDVCVNLRWPAAGETSGIAMKLMALGKPVAVTDSGEYERFPEGAVVRIDPGEAEAEMLARMLDLLAVEPAMRQTIGAAARRIVTTKHAIERVIEDYWKALRGVSVNPPAEPGSPAAL